MFTLTHDRRVSYLSDICKANTPDHNMTTRPLQ